MASYHSSFTYLGKNSAKEGFIIASFDPDNGFTDAFLGMDQIYEDYYDGTKKFLYGTKYNTSANISITLVKADGTDLSVADNRRLFRWLTGARTASWLDLHEGKEIRYSFLGTVTNPQQYKMDGRVVGISIEFASVSPWAFSAPQVFDCSIFQLMDIDNGAVYRGGGSTQFGVAPDGGWCVSSYDPGSYFNVTDDGILYLDNMYRTTIDNQSDDLYTYIYLDIEYHNDNGTYVSIKNNTLGEETFIDDVAAGETINISAKQFIVSDIPNKIFGDTFNFVWTRLQPGENDLVIDGNGKGSAKFTYRYPMKIGDSAMDISTYGSDPICEDCASIPSYNTVDWDQIINTPTSISGYGISDAYTAPQVDKKIEEIDVTAAVAIDENELNNMLGEVLDT